MALPFYFTLWCALALGGVTLAEQACGERMQVESFRTEGLEGRYTDLYKAVSASWVVPGLGEDFIPQGVAWVPNSGYMLVSGAFTEIFSKTWYGRTVVGKRRTAVYLVEHPSGKPIRLAILAYRSAAGEKSKPMRRKAGGIAVHGRNFWIPGGMRLYRFSLDELLDAKKSSITMKPDTKAIAIDSSGSCVSVVGDWLLVGSFVRPFMKNPFHIDSRAAHKDRMLTQAYRLDSETGLPARDAATYKAGDTKVLRPSFVIAHGRKVQGLAARDDGWIAISMSYGDNDSTVELHRVGSLLDGPDAPGKIKLPDGTSVPLLKLDESTRKFQCKAPPGSEGCAWNGDNLAVAFEGGARPYRDRWKTIEDRVLVLEIKNQ